MRHIECPATDCGSVNVVCVDRDFALFRCNECGTVFDEDDEMPADMRLQSREEDEDDE